eukprot:COSAG06_NODE_7773_length_2379_cov_1.265235_4_plen_107_part_00
MVLIIATPRSSSTSKRSVSSTKTVFFCHLYIKCIILPRQARDKHREKHSKIGAGEFEAYKQQVAAAEGGEVGEGAASSSGGGDADAELEARRAERAAAARSHADSH